MAVITYVATGGLEAASLHDGAVLYNLQTGKFILLNRSAAVIWTGIASPSSLDELLQRVLAAFPDVSAAVAQQDIASAVEQMNELEILTVHRADEHVPAADVVEPSRERSAYEQPSARVLDEEELLKIFQMTAAEISVASCWWATCPSGCP